MKTFKVVTWVTERSWYGTKIEAETKEEAENKFKELVEEDPSILEPVGSKYHFEYDLDKISSVES